MASGRLYVGATHTRGIFALMYPAQSRLCPTGISQLLDRVDCRNQGLQCFAAPRLRCTPSAHLLQSAVYCHVDGLPLLRSEWFHPRLGLVPAKFEIFDSLLRRPKITGINYP